MKLAHLTFIFLTLLGFSMSAECRDDDAARNHLNTLLYTTPAYQKAVLRLLLNEANDAATALHLKESTPITGSELTDIVIDPPQVGEKIGGVGVVGTSNYEYSVAAGKKLSNITSSKLDSERARHQLQTQYLWPINRCDTNEAYQLATNWLAALRIDVQRLNRNCKLDVWWWRPDGAKTNQFVPPYIVVWKGADGPAASVELFAPTRIIGQLNIASEEYIQRMPVIVTNAAELLKLPNASNSKTAPSRHLTNAAY